MKQKVVLGVSLSYKKSWPNCFLFGELTCPSKALKIVSGFHGVESVTWKDDKSKLEVTGEIDPVCLTRKLRKKIGPIKIISVEEKKEEKKEEKEEKKIEYIGTQLVPWPPVYDNYNPDPCTIL